MICDKTLFGIEPTCEPLQRGFEADGVIFKRSDIDWSASSIDGTTAEIVLKTGVAAALVKQPYNSPFNGSEMSLNVGTYVSTWNKNINVVLMSVGPNTSEVVNGFVGSDCVLILRNKTKEDGTQAGKIDADSAEYEIFGLEQGLKVSAGTRTPYDEETLGGTLLTLTETGADNHGIFLWKTSKTVTDAMYAALMTSSNNNNG